jgi:hypothetical protein
VLERTASGVGEGSVPGQELVGAVSPELVGVLNGLLVESLVFLEVC